MGYTYSGDAVLGVSLNVNTPKPLDIRAVVNSTQDLYSIPESTAYIGMTVANIADGNIYMLIDKSNINNKSGWKASYESIQIIACTDEEYKQWLENTEINGEMFTPKVETLPFIHANTYYYLYENSDSQEYYVTKSWIEEALGNKASSGDVESIQISITSRLNELGSNLTTLENKVKTDVETIYTHLEDNYYNIESIDESLSNINEDLKNNYVTKESLRGDQLEGEDNFVFVTQKQYEDDQTLLNQEIDNLKEKSIKTNDNAVLNSLKATSIKVNDKEVATTKEINELPKHITLTDDEYKNLENKDPNTYYYIQQPDGDYGWVTINQLNAKLEYLIDQLNNKFPDLKLTLNPQSES